MIEKDEKVEITFEDVVVPDSPPGNNYIDVDTNTGDANESIFYSRWCSGSGCWFSKKTALGR